MNSNQFISDLHYLTQLFPSRFTLKTPPTNPLLHTSPLIYCRTNRLIIYTLPFNTKTISNVISYEEGSIDDEDKDPVLSKWESNKGLEENDELDRINTTSITTGATNESSDNITYSFTYDIIYSFTYSAPRLYFQVYSTHTNSYLTELHEVEHVLKQIQSNSRLSEVSNYNDSNVDASNKNCSGISSNNVNMSMRMSADWLSCEFHPVLNQPCFSIHPCQTVSLCNVVAQISINSNAAATNTNITIPDSTPRFTVMTWLSLYGPYVGLTLPSTGESIKKIAESFNSTVAVVSSNELI